MHGEPYSPHDAYGGLRMGMVVGIEKRMFRAILQAKVGGQCPAGAQGSWALHSKDSLCIQALHGSCPSGPHVDLQRTLKANAFLSPGAGRCGVCVCLCVHLCGCVHRT